MIYWIKHDREIEKMVLLTNMMGRLGKILKVEQNLSPNVIKSFLME